MTASQKFTQKLYEQAAEADAAAGAAGGGAGGAGSTPNDDDVVDAEIVDEDEGQLTMSDPSRPPARRGGDPDDEVPVDATERPSTTPSPPSRRPSSR